MQFITQEEVKEIQKINEQSSYFAKELLQMTLFLYEKELSVDFLEWKRKNNKTK